MAGLLAVFAEFEREIMRERVRAGLEHTRQNSQRLGGPKTASLHADRVGSFTAPESANLRSPASRRSAGHPSGAFSKIRLNTENRPCLAIYASLPKAHTTISWRPSAIPPRRNMKTCLTAATMIPKPSQWRTSMGDSYSYNAGGKGRRRTEAAA
jgi:hypothetical protein